MTANTHYGRTSAVLMGIFLLAALAVTTTNGDDPDSRVPRAPPRKNDKEASYDIDDSTWTWIPVLIVGLFTALMLMSVKSDRWFDGKSLRLWLMRFVSIETLYNSLKDADAHEWKEQYDIEIGHQVFMALGTLLLIINVFFNPNADKRYVMAVLTYLQIFCLIFNILFDMILIKSMGRVDVVRSVNTKLRFSHCIYQVILFCTDFIGGSLHLPIDCFVWATVHYSYEAVGLAIEGLNVIGMSEFAIIAIVNAQIIGTEVASTGWTCAFGISSLAVSIISMIGGQIFKWRLVVVSPRKAPTPSSSAGEEHDDGHNNSSHHGGHGTKKSSLHPRRASIASHHRAVASTEETPLRASAGDEEMQHSAPPSRQDNNSSAEEDAGRHSVNATTIIAISQPLIHSSSTSEQ
ncbi:membrane-associated protein, putative [Bodo saltans]|uniref:Membrane-associated protein, putative n=1 Tax=Bodo saltans TaxID=75058 RepID=A0A0S4IN92_BODSA|nr:membrane-associated protein, putative [Bodo saltans]|eukprot:CUF62955.1 membrane-associated protein, putative [Bodo saltans]